MPKVSHFANKTDPVLLVGIFILLLLSILVLRSIAPSLFPGYFFYLLISLVVFFLFTQIDFEVLSLFSWHFYFLSLLFLLIPLAVGQVTRGAVRWIPVGLLTIQPAEIVRPFLLIFFANFLTRKRTNIRRLVGALLLLAAPLALVLVQPALGMAILFFVGFLGILLAANFQKRYLLVIFLIGLALLPLIWSLLAPYQKQRITSFLDPVKDPFGSGYNSLQATISVGSGRLFGRGLGKGVGTQLAFLPEKHSDFIFAAVSEEMGFLGAGLALAAIFVIFARLLQVVENPVTVVGRAYVSGLFLTLVVQTVIHVGMNMGLLPITGLPFPLLSAGGSSLIGTMIGLAIAMGAKKD